MFHSRFVWELLGGFADTYHGDSRIEQSDGGTRVNSREKLEESNK